MRCIQLILATGVLVALAAGVIAAEPEVPDTPAKHWTADNGNGTYSNPLFYEEFEDPDVIRVGDDYYFAGTTMHMNPGPQGWRMFQMESGQVRPLRVDAHSVEPGWCQA